MENKVITCGFSEQEKNLLSAVIPAEYDLRHAEDVTDMIVSSGLCYIISSEGLNKNEYRLLRSYCIEAGDYGNERAFWIGENPPCELVTVYSSLLDFMLDVENALQQAQVHYNTREMYGSEYGALPARAIADSLEQDVFAAFEKRFHKTPETRIAKQLRQEWTALLEASAVPELAAVYELSQWLKCKSIPYYMEGSVTSGLIPFLLGITRSNPLPKALGGYDLVWQTFCSYGRRPSFVFHLPETVKPQIERWNQNHWLKKLAPDLEPFRNSTTDISTIHFQFDIVQTKVPRLPAICREDIFHCFVQNDFLEKDAFRAMEVITLGGYLPANMMEVLTDDRLKHPNLPSRAELTERYLFMNAEISTCQER